MKCVSRYKQNINCEANWHILIIPYILCFQNIPLGMLWECFSSTYTLTSSLHLLDFKIISRWKRNSCPGVLHMHYRIIALSCSWSFTLLSFKVQIDRSIIMTFRFLSEYFNIYVWIVFLCGNTKGYPW